MDGFIHKRLMDLYKLYIIVGGMPSSIVTYLETNNLQKVIEIQKEIINQYKKDILKYDSNNKLYIEKIFSLIPRFLNSKNKRFIFKSLNENLKFSRYENSFVWLEDKKMALPCYNVKEVTYLLLLNKSQNLFKLFSSDVGLLACQYTNKVQLII